MAENKKPVKCTPSVMKKCAWAYQYNANTLMYCDYLERAGERRGCPPEACTKFKQRKKALVSNEK